MTDQRFPEAETLSIKRLKVAIEKANWELLEKGLEKAEYLRKAGQAFKQTIYGRICCSGQNGKIFRQICGKA